MQGKVFKNKKNHNLFPKSDIRKRGVVRAEKRHGTVMDAVLRCYGARFTDEETEADSSSQCPLGISHSPLGLLQGWIKGLTPHSICVLQKELITWFLLLPLHMH